MVKKEDAIKNTNEAIEEAVKTDDNSATVTMQGVSGKTITSKVKVFKANKREKPVVEEETTTLVQAVETTTAAAAVPAAPQVEAEPKPAEAASKQIEAEPKKEPVFEPALEKAATPAAVEAAAEAAVSVPLAAVSKEEFTPRKISSRKDVAAENEARLHSLEKAKAAAPSNTFAHPAPAPVSDTKLNDEKTRPAGPRKISSAKQTAERPLTQRPPTPPQQAKPQVSEARPHPAAPKAAVPAASISPAPAAAPAAPKPATPAGPRKLGNIFDQMKLNAAAGGNSGAAPTKIEKSGLAATAAAFARRQEDQKNRALEGADRSSSFQRGPGYSNGAYNAGGGYNSGGGQGGTYSPRPRPEGGGQGGYNRGGASGGGQGGYNRGGAPGGGPGTYNRGGAQGGGPGGYNRGGAPGGGGFRGRPAPGASTGFDKDKDDDNKSQVHARKAPVKKKTPEGLDIFAAKPAKAAASFSARDAIDKNKTRDGKTPRGPVTQRRKPFSAQDMDGEFGGRRGGRRPKRDSRKFQPIAVLSQVSLPEILTVKEFAEAIKKTSADVIKALMKLGEMATLNQNIDFDTASIIANEFGIKTEKIIEVTEEDILFDDTEDNEADLSERPPVVAVMGHVDHGKTSLLDYIRHAHVASGEAGGITQHIGAYMVRVNNRKITFLDTPGHEAFTSMRARGAMATDIAILVVAADDGVMPQTIEAIHHAKAANTTIVVAINKIDKPGANIDRVKQELATHDVISEDWGGTTVMVPVSAKTGVGIDDLLEMLLLTADILDLKANPEAQAKGIVIEAKLDKNRGVLATVLVQRGTLHQGDTLVTGSIVGNVRAMVDASGNTVKKAGPSVPVEILGLPDVPEAGELFYVVEDEKIARQLAEKRRIAQRESAIHGSSRMSLDNLFIKMAAGEVKDLNLIVKADVVGSVEALRQSLEKLTNEDVRVQVIHQAVGAITETDIRLAEVSNAIVIGFNVRPVNNASEIAKEAGVDVRLYRVIYNAIEDIQAAMKGMLAPEFKEQVTGHIELREIFKVSNIGTIGGAYVTDGKVHRNSQVRLVRNGVVVHEGKLASLRRFKDDVKEVSTGYECGISLENYNDIKVGDVIEAFEMKEVDRQ